MFFTLKYFWNSSWKPPGTHCFNNKPFQIKGNKLLAWTKIKYVEKKYDNKKYLAWLAERMKLYLSNPYGSAEKLVPGGFQLLEFGPLLACLPQPLLLRLLHWLHHLYSLNGYWLLESAHQRSHAMVHFHFLWRVINTI